MIKLKHLAVATALGTFCSATALEQSIAQQQMRGEQKESAQGSDAKQSPARAAKSEDSGTMQRADRDMRQVLEKLQELGAKPLGTQSVEDTRKGPTPADAVKAVMAEQGKTMPPPDVRKENVNYKAAAGEQPARVYIPETKSQNQQGLPVIVYYHGGGWVIADLDTYDASPTALASKANAIVVSIEYRHAPENKFPAAHQDAFAGYQWVIENAKQWGGDPQRIAVAGESAGGNLALNVAIMARDKNVQAPVHMLLVYPVAGTDLNTPSYQENMNAMPLGQGGMKWFVENTTKGPDDLSNPMLDLVGRANLDKLPDATIIAAEIDPLRSEGRALADKLRKAGSDVRYQNYEGVTHEFFGMAPLVRDATRAQNLAARELRDAFSQKSNAKPGGTTTGERSRSDDRPK